MNHTPFAPTAEEPSRCPAKEWDALASTLRDWGIVHLSVGQGPPVGMPTSPETLFARLFLSGEPRLHQATIPLLLTHPRLATVARDVIDHLPSATRDRAMRRYVAAAALQRMARTRIADSLGEQPLLPPAYLGELGLPSLDEGFGRPALLALAAAEEARYGYDAWGTYRLLLDLFLNEIRRRGWGKTKRIDAATD